MEESGMVPLFYHHDIDVAKAVLKACYDGGARLMEFTSRGDFALEIFNQLIKYVIAELPGMILGVVLLPMQQLLHSTCFVEQILLLLQYLEKTLRWFVTVEKYYGLQAVVL